VALPFLVAANCDVGTTTGTTFTVQFVVDVDGIDAPGNMTVESGQGFILPAVERQQYRVLWQAEGTQDERRSAGSIMPYAVHNTGAGNTLRMIAHFDRIPYTPEELMQQFVGRANAMIADLATITTEAELRTAVVAADAYIAAWNMASTLAPVGLNTAQLALETTRARDLFIARINGLVTALGSINEITPLGTQIAAIQSYVTAWNVQMPILVAGYWNETAFNGQRTRHRDLFAAKINGLIEDLEAINDADLNDLIAAIDAIAAYRTAWTGLNPNTVINQSALTIQIERQNGLIAIRNMHDFVTQINEEIYLLADMDNLFSLRLAIASIEARYDAWTGVEPEGIEWNYLDEQKDRAVLLGETDQGEMADTAMAILEEIRGFGVTVLDANIVSTSEFVEIRIAVAATPAITIWGSNITRTDIRIHRDLAYAEALANITANMDRYGHTTIFAGANAFSRWFFRTLIEHGAPGSLLDGNTGQIDAQFTQQRNELMAELERHLNPSRVAHPEFVWSMNQTPVFPGVTQVNRISISIGST